MTPGGAKREAPTDRPGPLAGTEEGQDATLVGAVMTLAAASLT
jgi:hypothetical protein